MSSARVTGAPTQRKVPSLLALKCSLASNSKSNLLLKEFVAKWQAKYAGKVVVRDLDADALPHLTEAEMEAWMTAESARTEKQKKLAKLSDDLITEFKAAGTVVVGMPMYNFAVPTTFKAWLDRLCRAGVTFKYSSAGPSSLLPDDKRVLFLCSRGGVFAGTPIDTQTPYLRSILGLIGQTHISFIYAEGLNVGAADKAIAEAKKQIAAFV